MYGCINLDCHGLAIGTQVVCRRGTKTEILSIETMYLTQELCSGAIAGLVAATPSSGFINPHAGIACGIIAAAICNYATKLKFFLRVDDTMDIFTVHGLAGMIGLMINAFFGTNYIPALDGIAIGDAAIPGGWFSHHWPQLGLQLAYIAATSSYSFAVTSVILILMNLIPGLELRVSPDEERKGIDDVELGEFFFDFVEVRRDFDSWSSPDTRLIEGVDENGFDGSSRAELQEK